MSGRPCSLLRSWRLHVLLRARDRAAAPTATHPSTPEDRAELFPNCLGAAVAVDAAAAGAGAVIVEDDGDDGSGGGRARWERGESGRSREEALNVLDVWKTAMSMSTGLVDTSSSSSSTSSTATARLNEMSNWT